MLARLKPLNSNSGDTSVAVRGPTFRIGRADDCHLRLDNPTVGRHHCELTVVGDSLFICDLHSLNGTFVNDYRVYDRTELFDGDVVALSTSLFRIETNPSVTRDLQSSNERWLV